MTDRVLLMGDGHGALAALQGLRTSFAHVDVVSRDADLIAAAGRQADVYSHIGQTSHKIVVMAGYQTILKPDEIEGRQVLNVHYSLLPRYRGMHSVVWAMLNDEEYIGLTIHLADVAVDRGAVVHQHRFALTDDMTSRDVMMRLNQYVSSELGVVVAAFLTGEIVPATQDEGHATWVARRTADDCKIDFSATNRKLSLFFRALVEPYPLPYIETDAGRFEVTRHELSDHRQDAKEGRVACMDDSGAWISVSEGSLLIKALRGADGAPRHPAEVFHRGQQLA